MKSLVLAAALTAATPLAAEAMVGGAPPADDAIGRSVVTIVGSRGTFCSGALIAPDLVLTAAHCALRGAVYKLVVDRNKADPRLLGVRRLDEHPDFAVKAILNHRASADVALLQLAEPLGAPYWPAPIGAPQTPAAGSRFTIAGIGVTARGDGKTGGVVRAATLSATGQPGALQLRLVDPATDNKKPGLGACTGDSGAPVFEQQNGRAIIVGVVSWSTGPNNSDGCGGLTGVTPLGRYRDWIVQTARAWGVAL